MNLLIIYYPFNVVGMIYDTDLLTFHIAHIAESSVPWCHDATCNDEVKFHTWSLPQAYMFVNVKAGLAI